MSASKLTCILVMVMACHLVSMQPTTTPSWFQPLQSYSTNQNIELINRFVRSLHPTELLSATLSDVNASQDKQNYQLLYVTLNGQNYMSLVRQTTPLQSISELDWNKLEHTQSAATANPKISPLTGGFTVSGVSANSAEFDLIDKFVKGIKKEELKDAKAVSVRTQIVAGINYQIIYETPSGRKYEAIVFYQSWTSTTQLISFKEFRPVISVASQNLWNNAVKIPSWKALKRRAVSAPQRIVSSQRRLLQTDSSIDLDNYTSYNSQPQITSSSSYFNSSSSVDPSLSSTGDSTPGSWQQVTNLNDPTIQRIDQLVRYNNPSIGNGSLTNIQIQNGSSYQLQYNIPNSNGGTDVFETIVTYNPDSDSIFTVSQSTTSSSTSTTAGVIPTIASTTSSQGNGLISSDGYTDLPNYQTDSNFLQVDQYARSTVPDLQGATINSVQVQNSSSGINYKIQYTTTNNSILQLVINYQSMIAAQASNIPASSTTTTSTTTSDSSSTLPINFVQSTTNNNMATILSPPSTTANTYTSSGTNVSTSETALTNFQSDAGVQKVNDYVQSQIPSLSTASIVGVWVSNTPEGLTNYRIRYLTVDGSFVEITLAYQPQKGVVQINNQTSLDTSASQTILATTPDGYSLLGNFGINPDFIKADQYVRSQMTDLNGAQVSAVWTMQIPNVGTSYRIRYTTTSGIVLDVTLVYRTDTGQFEFNPTPLTTPPTTVTTTTVTNVGYQALQNYSTNSDFQSVDQYIRSQIQTLANAQIIAVWVDNQPNSTNYRIQYLLPDGSIQEVVISYVSSTQTYQIISSSQLAPPVVKTTTNINVTQTTYTPVTTNVTTTNQTTTVPAYNTTTTVSNTSTTFNPNWQPTNYTAPPNITNTTNTSTITSTYFPGITTTSNYTGLGGNGNDNTTNTSTVNTTWDYSQYVNNNTPPAYNVTTTNTSVINSTWVQPPPSTNYTNTTVVKWNNTNWTRPNTSIVPTPPRIPQGPYVPPSTNTNTTIVINNTINQYQTVDCANTNIVTIDNYCRKQVPQINGGRLASAWKMAGSNTYKLLYITLNNVSLIIIINQLGNSQFVVASVTPNTSVNNTITTNNYQILNNYANNINFQRVDSYARSAISQLTQATIVQVWIQLVTTGTNYRIVYLTASGQQYEVVIRINSAGGTLQLISNKTISTSNQTTQTNTNQTISTNNVYTSLNNWSTNSDFIAADSFVRNQLPQLINSQIIAVWILVQSQVGVSYKIQYLLNSNTFQVIVSKINSNNNFVIVSNNLTAAYQPLSNFQSDSEFLKADAFARTQLSQLQTAQVIAVWVQYTIGTNYRIQYLSSQNVTIEVIISYDVTTDSYTFQLISPLSLLSSVVVRDPLCKTFVKNVCTQCSTRSYFDANRRCQQVNPQCNTYTSNGQCTSCYDGYALSSGNCLLAANLLSQSAGCETTFSDGRCGSCSVGYLLVSNVCRRNS